MGGKVTILNAINIIVNIAVQLKTRFIQSKKKIYFFIEFVKNCRVVCIFNFSTTL